MANRLRSTPTCSVIQIHENRVNKLLLAKPSGDYNNIFKNLFWKLAVPRSFIAFDSQSRINKTFFCFSIFIVQQTQTFFIFHKDTSILKHKRNISKLRLMSSSVKRIRTESDILRTEIALQCLNFFGTLQFDPKRTF